MNYPLRFVNIFTNFSSVKDATHKAFYKTLGARIRELRGALPQEQLAKAVGLTRTSIVNIESGQQKLLVHNLFRIAAVLGIRPSEILAPLERKRGELPDIDIRGPNTEKKTVTSWVQMVVEKAKSSHPQ